MLYIFDEGKLPSQYFKLISSVNMKCSRNTFARKPKYQITMSKYVITADKYEGIISHNFFEGFSITVKDGDKVVVEERGMPLIAAQNKASSLCKEAGIHEITVKDLDEDRAYTVKVDDIATLIRY